jgi:phosphonate transport system substrate-binding protein
VYEAVTEEVGRRLDVATDLVVETSYEACERDVHEVCFVCSLPYVTFERRGTAPAVPVAAPVLRGRRYGGKPIYFSDVIVRTDAPFRSFSDLRGASWAFNEPLSWSGYGITRYHLLTMGETDGYFGRVIEAGFHEESMRLVAKGEVDALGPSTIQPVAVSKRVPVEMREAIRGVLVAMGEHPRAREGWPWAWSTGSSRSVPRTTTTSAVCSMPPNRPAS